jgi:hypothetical protein
VGRALVEHLGLVEVVVLILFLIPLLLLVVAELVELVVMD